MTDSLLMLIDQEVMLQQTLSKLRNKGNSYEEQFVSMCCSVLKTPVNVYLPVPCFSSRVFCRCLSQI